MTRIRELFAFAAVAACVAHAGTAARLGAQQIAEPIAVSFSNPSMPGTLNVGRISGTITIKGGSRKDVLITTRSAAEVSGPRGAAGRGRAGRGAATPATPTQPAKPGTAPAAPTPPAPGKPGAAAPAAPPPPPAPPKPGAAPAPPAPPKPGAAPAAPPAPPAPTPGQGGRGGRGGGAAAGTPQPSDIPPGFKRLTQPIGFTVEERNNEISLSPNGFNAAMDVEVQVPSRTNLRLKTISGAVIVDGVDGDIEAETVSGPITLTNVAGSVVAQSNNGNVTATVSRVNADKAMSFTTFSGGVDVTLPAAIRAVFKLRSYRGDVYTDFDLVLKSATVPARQGGGRYRVEINDAIYGTANGGGPEIELRTYNGRVMLRKGQ